MNAGQWNIIAMLWVCTAFVASMGALFWAEFLYRTRCSRSEQQQKQPERQPQQPVQITNYHHYHLPADNRHMVALATRLQQEKRLALGGGK